MEKDSTLHTLSIMRWNMKMMVFLHHKLIAALHQVSLTLIWDFLPTDQKHVVHIKQQPWTFEDSVAAGSHITKPYFYMSYIYWNIQTHSKNFIKTFLSIPSTVFKCISSIQQTVWRHSLRCCLTAKFSPSTCPLQVQLSVFPHCRMCTL